MRKFCREEIFRKFSEKLHSVSDFQGGRREIRPIFAQAHHACAKMWRIQKYQFKPYSPHSSFKEKNGKIQGSSHRKWKKNYERDKKFRLRNFFRVRNFFGAKARRSRA